MVQYCSTSRIQLLATIDGRLETTYLSGRGVLPLLYQSILALSLALFRMPSLSYRWDMTTRQVFLLQCQDHISSK